MLHKIRAHCMQASVPSPKGKEPHGRDGDWVATLQSWVRLRRQMDPETLGGLLRGVGLNVHERLTVMRALDPQRTGLVSAKSLWEELQ